MGTRKRGFKMIRPEKYQFNWKPKTKSKEDLELVRKLEKLVNELNINKTQLTRKALNNLVALKGFYRS